MSKRNARGVGLTTIAARTLFAPADESAGRADLVARRLAEAIRLGLILDRERLPPEPRLAEQVGVSIVTLREALATLREQGLVTTRRGRGGGTFVCAPANVGERLVEQLGRFSVQELRELGDHRGAVAGTAARLAAQRAVPAEIRTLRHQLDRLCAAETPSECHRADMQLAVAVAAAAQSSRLTHEEMQLRASIGDLLWMWLGDAERDELVRARGSLVEAVERREPELARDLAEQQVAADTTRLIRLRLRAGEQPVADGSARWRRGPAVGEVLGGVVAELEAVFGALDVLGRRFGALVATVAGRPRRKDLEALRPAIFDALSVHGALVTGAGLIAAPDLLVDAPHWLEWWWTTSGAAPEPLHVNLDPAAPDFFDYTTADWYATSDRSGAPHAAGPHVDYACTGDYAITLSAPVRPAGGAMLGVAAADVLVSSLERRVLPELIAFGGPLALTNADGRVIVSTAPDVASGQRIRLDDDLPESTPTGSPLRSWVLVQRDG